jgi:TolB protein
MHNKSGKIMKILPILFILFATSLATANNNIELSVSGSQQTKMPIAIIVLDSKNDELNTIATTIQEDLAFTDQFQPFIKKYNANTPKKEVRKNVLQLANQGTPLALCISNQSPKTIDWQLYDTTQCTPLKGKKSRKRGSAIRGWAHAIADETRKTLTGHDPIFSSRIAYCKDKKDAQGKITREICIADINGTNIEAIVHPSSIVIAPRWHIQEPELFYSEYTKTSAQLKSISVKKIRKKETIQSKNISHFDEGINMGITFAPNGKDNAFCASRGNGNCQIYLHKNGNLKRCTKNNGNNDSPVFMDNDRICFCSDFQTKSPQIYIGNLTTGHLQRITTGGYCTSPSYCPKTNKIVYHKMIQGTMQIMVYDCITKTHTQLTFNAGSKHEASWSPDGTFILYSHQHSPTSSRLVTFNTLTQKTKYLTSVNDNCSYPHWSPCYSVFPVTI